MDHLKMIVNFTNTILWDYVLIFGLIGIGVFMTIKLKFLQFTRVFPALKKMIVDIIKKKPVEEGKMSPFQALSTAVAAQVGTGNIVGVATAIAAGGPGAAFWMIISAFFGMATIFSESVLAQKYREVKEGEVTGGPAYYMKNGLKSKGLAMFFAITCIVALGIVGIMVQSNSVAGSVSDAFGIPVPVITIVLTLVVFRILVGGMEKIASFSEKVVPAMAGLYILGSIVVVIMNMENFVPAIKSIIMGAFSPEAISGGVLGVTVQQTIRYGLARGLFSNEAGMGSTPHSHAVADVSHPAEQGFTAMIGVFISTFLICLSTVMINITSGAYNSSIPAIEMSKEATIMTQNSFAAGFGSLGGMFLSICLSFFALTTIVGWYFFAEANVKFVFNSKPITINIFKAIALIALILGTVMDATFAWQLADMFMGMMAVPNIVALFFLSKEVKEILEDYDRCLEEGHIHWDYEHKALEGNERKKGSVLRKGLSTTVIK